MIDPRPGLLGVLLVFRKGQILLVGGQLRWAGRAWRGSGVGVCHRLGGVGPRVSQQVIGRQAGLLHDPLIVHQVKRLGRANTRDTSAHGETGIGKIESIQQRVAPFFAEDGDVNRA